MQIPIALLDALEGLPGFDRQSFLDVHQREEQVTSIRLNPSKPVSLENPENKSFPFVSVPGKNAIPWTDYGYYLEQRPSFTFDPFFHAGCYYVQEASSMFLEQAMKQLLDLSRPLSCLDLCAAPGGKSTHIQSLISNDSILVSNEVIKSRSHVLVDNLIKWGAENVIVTNNDPSVFQKLPGFFDLMVVDAPCSGSGLFRKDAEAISEWSPNHVVLCYQRQQRILSDALPTLKENGILIYSTCSYSREEDEEIADWLVNEWNMENCSLRVPAPWNIVETQSSKSGSTGYRFYPDKVKGEGFFLSCFRKKASEPTGKIRPARIENITAKEKSILTGWLKEGKHFYIKEHDRFYLLPSQLAVSYPFLRSVLNIRYVGTAMGQIMKDKLVPDHSLALSTGLSENITCNEVSYEEAIRYLQRADFKTDTQGVGWQTITYGHQILGWINVLPNRINNYYPKESRILKQQDGPFEK